MDLLNEPSVLLYVDVYSFKQTLILVNLPF